MNRTIELMHAVLDGEATPEETRELDGILAADPAARAQFDELRHLFDGLSRVPRAFPPEGLVASVMAGIPQQPARPVRFDQPFSLSRVIGQTSKEARGNNPGKSTTAHQVFRTGPYLGGANMSDQQRGSFGKRKIWIGAGIAAAAVVIAVSSGIDFPPGGNDATGTIVPAQRYRATQNAADDVKGGNPSAATSVQLNSAAANASNSAANDAVNRSANDAVNRSANDAVNRSANDAVNRSANDAVNRSANDAVNRSANDAVNRSANDAVNRSANDAVNRSANDAVNRSANNAANQLR